MVTILRSVGGIYSGYNGCQAHLRMPYLAFVKLPAKEKGGGRPIPSNKTIPVAGFLNGLWENTSGQPQVCRPEVPGRHWSGYTPRPIAFVHLRHFNPRLT